MIIKTISEAESFVESHQNFYWDGWDIVHAVQDDYAEYLPSGWFNRSDGKWYKRTIFKYEESGWNIADAVVK